MTPLKPGDTWTETILHIFNCKTDGCFPFFNTGLVLGKDGELYGTTTDGSISGQNSNAGTVFELKPPSTAGGDWTYTVLYAFTGLSDGGYPEASVTFGRDGRLYGTTSRGGPGGFGGNGVVFALTPPATPGGTWTEEVLYTFQGKPDGANPDGPVILGSKGEIYGTTPAGGTDTDGTLFRLTPPAVAGGSWTETALYSFKCPGPDYAGLISCGNG